MLGVTSRSPYFIDEELVTQAGEVDGPRAKPTEWQCLDLNPDLSTDHFQQ